jgi:MSHA biogenesis protein MshO
MMGTTKQAIMARQRGVTMIEMIVVIIITGIIGGVIALFIRVPVQGYTDSVARAGATDAADLALRRMTRELRLALPNSVRVLTVAAPATRSIEFLQTTSGLRYLSEDDIRPNVTGGTFLNWNDATKTIFDVVGGLPSGRNRPVVGDYLVVYNLGEGQEPGNAYNCDVACNRTKIKAFVGTVSIEMESNPFPAQITAGAALMSPGKRIHVVSSAVTYVCNLASGKLTRYWDYPITASQSVTPAGGKSALLAENIKSCDFEYTNLASQHSGLIGLSLEVGIPGVRATSLQLEHQVHVDNTP